MGIKAAGKVDCEITLKSSTHQGKRWNELFVNIIQLLSSSNAQALGIEMIAGNVGSYPGGTGKWEYWDQTNYPGQRSFAVFRFLSASQGPFEVLVMHNYYWRNHINGGTAGSSHSPFNVGTWASEYIGSTLGTVALAFAHHASGTLTHPFNGTLNMSASTLGTQIWTTGSFGELSVFPRANSTGGSYATNRNYLHPINSNNSTYDYEAVSTREHIIATESSLCIATVGTNGSALTMYFGPWTPRADLPSTSKSGSYFMFANTDAGTNQNTDAIVYASTIGTTAGSYHDTLQGSISHPKSMFGSGSKAYRLQGLGGLDSSTARNKFINEDQGGVWEILPRPWIMIYEGTEFSYLGTADNFYIMYGPQLNSLNTISSSIVIGSRADYGVKLLLPWSGSAPGSIFNRSGREFFIDNWTPLGT